MDYLQTKKEEDNMRCSNCDREVLVCFDCKNPLVPEQVIWCAEELYHFCTLECLIRASNIKTAKVKGGQNE